MLQLQTSAGISQRFSTLILLMRRRELRSRLDLLDGAAFADGGAGEDVRLRTVSNWQKSPSTGGGSGYCVGHSRVHPSFLSACSAQRPSAAPQIHRLHLFSCDLDRHRSLRTCSRFHRIRLKKNQKKTNQVVAVGPGSAERRVGC